MLNQDQCRQQEKICYLNEEGELSSASPVAIPNEILIQGYATMVLTRHVDERMLTLQRQGTITFSMTQLGEEACSVASAAALGPNDWMYPQYRESGILFWRGFTIQQFVHQMFGNGNDLIKGRMMPNHFGSREHNVVHVSSPIATKIPHAAGCAYAMKLLGEPSIAICYFGEGATSEGDFHAGLNFAAVKKTPTIFFCRNNGYAISTPVCDQFASKGVSPKGIGYGVNTYTIDGNDFFAVYETVQKAKKECLDGQGPILIEALTYRMGAHSTSDDPSCYRQDQEVDKHAKSCPIKRLKLYLEKRGLWSEEKNQALLEEISKEVTEAIRIAKEAPPPTLKSLFEHVYFEMPQKLEQQYHDLKRFFPNEA